LFGFGRRKVVMAVEKEELVNETLVEVGLCFCHTEAKG